MKPVKEILLARAGAILAGPMSLDKAILVAVIAHAGQEDKGGNSYIRHPLRVMEECDSEDEMVAGVCHDVVEDTDITFEDLTQLGFAKTHVKSIDALTKREGETYPESIDRVLKDLTARKVKKHDIRDNCKLWRLKSKKLSDAFLVKMQCYVDALERLGEIDNKR